MNKINAEIVADSVCNGNRITTLILTFPRFILSELNTHRAFSRNSASSRAIPFETMRDMVQDDPFVPYAFQKLHKGMQGSEYYDTMEEHYHRQDAWLAGRDAAVDRATDLYELGVTKQLCNRMLEPYMWHKAIVTATEWDNFFELRAPIYQYTYDIPGGSVTGFDNSRKHMLDIFALNSQTEAHLRYSNYTKFDWLKNDISGTEIHFRLLAEAIYDARKESTPVVKKSGEWHIPFGDVFNRGRVNHLFGELTESKVRPTLEQYNELKLKIATARAARVSYFNYEGKDDYQADVKLFKRLLEEKHMSPFEHCAQAMLARPDTYVRNFKGWYQYRAIVENDYLKYKYDK